MRLCVPSQNGFVTDAPHRHSAMDLPEPFAETSGCPASSTMRTWATSSPRILYGPFAFTTMVIGIRVCRVVGGDSLRVGALAGSAARGSGPSGSAARGSAGGGLRRVPLHASQHRVEPE